MSSGAWLGSVSLPAGIVVGVVSGFVLFFYGISAWPVAILLLLAGLLSRSVTLFLLVFSLAWSNFVFCERAADRLLSPPDPNSQLVHGLIENLPEVHPDYTRFQFSPVKTDGQSGLPRRLLVYWYRDPPDLVPGELWALDLQLKPPWGQVNFQGQDRERWLFSEGIGALASVQNGVKVAASASFASQLDRLRRIVRMRISEAIPEQGQLGLVLALALADRSQIPAPQRSALGATGTAHLLAISGLHIGLAALLGFCLARVVLLVLPPAWCRGLTLPVAMLAGLLTATVYAGLAGFGTSTVRALIMLSVAAMLLLWRRSVHPWQALLLALAIILLLNPLSLLGAGLWLSFFAVGALLLLFSSQVAGRSWWSSLLRAQLGIMLFTLPLTAWWFQAVSLSGIVANLLAIPWVSFVVVPLVLLGLVLLPLSVTLSKLAFVGAAHGGSLLMMVLQWLAELPRSLLPLAHPGMGLVAIAALGGLILLLLRGLPFRWLGLVLLLPLLASGTGPGKDRLRIEVLDVGQGTAVLVNSGKHLLLYDSGPGDGEQYSQVDTVIMPAIVQAGFSAPDRILISHADMDHAGGLARLRELFPEADVVASLPGDGNAAVANGNPGNTTQACAEGLSWAWDNTLFEVLHPTHYLPYRGNDSSCVLAIRRGESSVLLPGDISAAIEQRLVQQGIGPFQLLLVPHHGSATSSTAGFLQRLAPQQAIATAGLGNRFGFPRPEIVQRYREHDIPLWTSGGCGALRIDLDAAGIMQARSARRARDAPWRWPAAAHCP